MTEEIIEVDLNGPEEVKEESKEEAVEILAEIDKLLADQVPDCGDMAL